MIVYGTNGSNMRTGQILNTECPNCNTKTTMNYSIFGKYAHIYWIPFFPYTKLTFVECGNCKKTFDSRNCTSEVLQKLTQEKNKKGNLFFPVWMFTGAFFVLLLIGFGIYDSQTEEENEKQYVNNPKINDIYHLKTTNGYFSSAKVTKSLKDSIYLSFNTFETTQMTGIDEIDIDKNYDTSEYGFLKNRIAELYKKDTIFSITRK